VSAAVRYVAFLRAINVGGRFLKMAALAEHFRALGCADVTTFLNSGNVLFRATAGGAASRADRLAPRLADGLEPLLGYRSEVFLRTEAEVLALAKRGAALLETVPADGDVNVALLNAPLTKEQKTALAALRTDLDDFTARGREVWWLCQAKQSGSKFSNAVFERKLKSRATFRRASMLVKLAEVIRASG
jgi:uncharacterized protein (DUF1697 family)